MIIADTGFWIGLFDNTDTAHLSCKRFLAQCQWPLITTASVLTETVHLPTQRRYQQIAIDLLAEHLGHGRIVSTDKRDFGAYRWKNRQPFQNLLENV
ncbi:MAG: hypothetical protein WC757_03780 [Candidatus Paceibacterota bacterium]|jgi:hypothetical protein